MTWTHPPQLALLEQTLANAREDPAFISDEDLISLVRATYWGANCWAWVEMSLAIVSAVCALRPQLADELIRDPIGVMIEGGLDNEADVIRQGVALARKSEPYVPLTDDGRTWLEQSWPLLEEQARAIYRHKLSELSRLAHPRASLVRARFRR